jgi:hypothetical protein
MKNVDKEPSMDQEAIKTREIGDKSLQGITKLREARPGVGPTTRPRMKATDEEDKRTTHLGDENRNNAVWNWTTHSRSQVSCETRSRFVHVLKTKQLHQNFRDTMSQTEPARDETVIAATVQPRGSLIADNNRILIRRNTSDFVSRFVREVHSR